MGWLENAKAIDGKLEREIIRLEKKRKRLHLRDVLVVHLDEMARKDIYLQQRHNKQLAIAAGQVARTVEKISDEIECSKYGEVDSWESDKDGLLARRVLELDTLMHHIEKVAAEKFSFVYGTLMSIETDLRENLGRIRELETEV